jgi:hypothetical protein
VMNSQSPSPELRTSNSESGDREWVVSYFWARS